jgi:hypothetical protein
MSKSPLDGPLEPVMITIRGHHTYKNRGKGKIGCGHLMANGKECRKAMFHRDHLSLPLSLNVVGSRGGHQTYRTAKAAWEELWCEQLEASGLPAGWREGATPGTPKIQAISVEALLCFPIKRHARDQGNFRWFLEKSLGDALVKGYGFSTGSKAKGDYEWHQVNPGGWLEDDSIYPTRRFDFGGLEIQQTPGEAWTRIVILPS